MTVKYDGKVYHQAHLTAYRTWDLDVVVMTAPPDARLVFVITATDVHAADAKEVRRIASRYGIPELLGRCEDAAASAA